MIVELVEVGEDENDRIAAVLNVTDDEGETRRMLYVFPKDTIEWRIAEYGLDPNDTDTLLDVVLYEPYVTIPKEQRLYYAGREEARGAMLSAVNEVKESASLQAMVMRMTASARKSIDTRVSTCRNKILQMSLIDPEAIELKRAEVDRVEAIAEEQRSRLMNRDRIKDLRESLELNKVVENGSDI